MNFLTSNEITLHYRLEGAPGATPLVFINSLGCDMRIWDAVVPHLQHDFRVIRFDKRGHGLSDTSPAPYRMRDLASDVIRLLDQLEVEQALLVGISVGGMIALQTALDAPQRVRALILCDTAARIGSSDYWNERIQHLRERGMESLADAILSRWFTQRFIEQNPALYRGFYNALTRMPLEGYIGTCAALGDTDLRNRAGEVTVPALVLCGAEDVAVTPDAARAFADSLPNAVFKVIDNAAHIPPVEQPMAVVEAIREFARKVAAPDERYETGMRVRREVLGNAHVDRAEANKTDFDADFQRLITEMAWGAVWARPGLDRVTRHLLTISILAALGHEHELAMHIRATRNTGVSPQELKEALLHVAIYAGVPAANNAFRIAKAIYAETATQNHEEKTL